MSDVLSQFHYLYGKPTAKAKLKAKAEHFKVSEDLGYEFAGAGEHLMIRIRKTGENTSFVANELAKACKVKTKDVSWAGLKDRHAVTEQWLSVHLPKGETPDFGPFLAQYPSIEILDITRHNKKLRPGDLAGNDFEITLSEVTDVQDVVARIEKLAINGVPNYFGSQRFGNQGNNLDEARRWGRENVRTRNQNKRSLYLSSARSWIFNRIVSARLEQGVFDSLLVGDVVEGRETTIVDEENLNSLREALAHQEVSITAAMAGDNALPTQADALLLEQPHLDDEPDLMALIRGNRMRHDRRAVLLKPKDLSWSQSDDQVTLTFSLDAGSFATSIVRELIEEEIVERVY
ncbi:tRNA pseudouridine(13) synthase TruD [Vibrio sp. 10N.261.55.A7]|uniref:tRNA pseudouridine(13) synthase TruD n=1 Tax=Vibrio sp. 10N.261.55.A7 TaxID=1880851 RepID=UPI000C845674|nr:tRNA pseudouridine(13) synthase TruD [Vibrio sp. 10N.261.55.A7]PMJ91290.1 tRNA pseudouridine(13) synthase TruD [Vibrio sp. 10N.261.55.A7]